MNAKEFFKKNKKIIIGCAIILALCGASFCAGRYVRLGVLQSSSSGIEQRIDNIGDAADAGAADLSSGIGLVNSGLAFTDIAIGNIDRATVLNIELQSKVDELIGVTETYQANLQLANTTINDLFDLSIKRAELDEEFIRRVIELSSNCKQSSSK